MTTPKPKPGRPKRDIEDWQSARVRRGEDARARNRVTAGNTDRMTNLQRMVAQGTPARDTKGTPLKPTHRGDRGGVFNPSANISKGIMTNRGRKDAEDIHAGSPQWGRGQTPEYSPTPIERSKEDGKRNHMRNARRRTIQRSFSNNGSK